MTIEESDKVRDRYARRVHAVDSARYSMLNASVWQAVHERQRRMIELFNQHGLSDLTEVRLLEVGAGSGGNLLEFLRLGFEPANLTGIELLSDRAEIARKMLPAELAFHCGDAAGFDIAPGSFDLVFQSVVFSSILDDSFQQKLADTMWQWVRPGGAVLWYDFTFNNPANKDVRGVPLSRVRELFPEGDIHSSRVTLAPPISRRVCRFHPYAYTLFNALPFLRTHLLCWIGKR